MEKLLYSRGDDRSIDSSCLQNTVKKLVSNLCETLICYRTHLRIEGTVGITIDDERAIVLHFGENIGRTCLQDDTPLKRPSYETEKHDNNYGCGVGESKQEARKTVAKTAAKDSVTSTALSEEPKMKAMPPIVTECQVEDNGLNVSSPSETAKVKHSPESNSSFCEPLDSVSLSSAGKNYGDRGQTAFGGRSESESATLLDMTTDILSNLFNNSGENREASLNSYYDRDRVDEPLQGCRLRQGSAIDALRQLYSKRFSSQGAETSTQQKYLDPDLYSGSQDHVASMSSGDLTGKMANVGRKDCSQNQVLLRELLFQKANPVADALTIQQPPPSKRRRFTHSNKSGANTSIADLLIRNNSSSGVSGQRSRLPAFSLEEAGAASQRETSSPETGHSSFPPGMTFDQDTDSSNYKFSQLLFSLVDSKRHGINQLSPAISEARQSGSASKNYDSTVYQTTHASDMASVKQETDDSEYDVT